jgi:hypothetical protein
VTGKGWEKELIGRGGTRGSRGGTDRDRQTFASSAFSTASALAISACCSAATSSCRAGSAGFARAVFGGNAVEDESAGSEAIILVVASGADAIPAYRMGPSVRIAGW